MSETEWAKCEDPLLMLDAIRETAQSDALRRFAVLCCEPFLEMLDEPGRRAIDVANRLTRGEATELERAQAEKAAFWLHEYNEDGDRHYYDADYQAAGNPPYQTDPRFAAAEAATGTVAADPWLGARLAARVALDASPKESRTAERLRLCIAIRSLMCASVRSG